MLLAADIGGTRARLGLFRPGGARPQVAMSHDYTTLDFDSLDDIVDAFLTATGTEHIEAIAIGVAGPVRGLTARMTNVPWVADASTLGERFDDCPVELLNDLEALAWSLGVLEPDELASLQDGVVQPSGSAALIAAGTGLGEAMLANVNGRFVPTPSEGGHADFAARTPRELALAAELIRAHGRVDNERVISGHGLVNVFQFTHGGGDVQHACGHVDGSVPPAKLPALISASALARRCDRCVEALEMFVEAYGAEAGNLALRTMATAGVYLGGGIAPQILPALETGAFMDAFRAKDPLVDFLRTLPVAVILNPHAGLLGAAVRAAELAETS